MTENQDIVCIAGVDFDPLWARAQQLVWRMPESNRILYVEAPISILSPVKDPQMRYKWGMWRQGVRSRKENLFLYSPMPVLPFGNRFRLINKINQWLIGKALKKVCRKIGFSQPVLLTYLPNTADMAGMLDEKLLVYDCVDEHSAFLGFNPEMVKKMEIDLVKKADIVLVTAQPLFEARAPYAKEIHLLRNAADVHHFQQARDPQLLTPEDIKSIPGPVLGFIGRIKEWIDLELLRQVALRKPEWSLVMIGPVEIDADISGLVSLSNVYFLGSKPKEELPGYLKKFDVCLNPFRMTDLSQAVNPLKFYEYIASGKPIVSTPMPEINILADLVEVGEGPEGFIEAIQRALKDDPQKIQKRLEFAEQNSWESRVEEMCRLIAAQLS